MADVAFATDQAEVGYDWLAAAGITTVETDPSQSVHGLAELSEDHLGMAFDSLTEIAAAQPDDKLALNGLRSIVNEIVERGAIDQAMQMAMTLGAMACLHDHVQDYANEIGKSVSDATDKNLQSVDKKDEHHTSSCQKCKTGRPCSKRK